MLCYLDNEKIEGDNGQTPEKNLHKFETYITANRALIPNYGERWRNQEAIATGFVESAVNQIVSKRFAKRQTDAVDEKGRAPAVANTDLGSRRLEKMFQRWYPAFRQAETGT